MPLLHTILLVLVLSGQFFVNSTVHTLSSEDSFVNLSVNKMYHFPFIVHCVTNPQKTKKSVYLQSWCLQNLCRIDNKNIQRNIFFGLHENLWECANMIWQSVCQPSLCGWLSCCQRKTWLSTTVRSTESNQVWWPIFYITFTATPERPKKINRKAVFWWQLLTWLNMNLYDCRQDYIYNALSDWSLDGWIALSLSLTHTLLEFFFFIIIDQNMFQFSSWGSFSSKFNCWWGFTEVFTGTLATNVTEHFMIVSDVHFLVHSLPNNILKFWTTVIICNCKSSRNKGKKSHMHSNIYLGKKGYLQNCKPHVSITGFTHHPSLSLPHPTPLKKKVTDRPFKVVHYSERHFHME